MSAGWQRCVLVVAVLLALLGAYCQTESREAAAPGADVSAELRTLATERESSAELAFGEARALTVRHGFAREETVYLLPYLWAWVRDVGTAGSGDWAFWPNVIVARSVNGTLTALDGYELEHMRLTVTADENTAVEFSGWSGQGTKLELESYDPDEGVGARVATMDSDVAANAVCEVAVSWAGTVTVREQGLGRFSAEVAADGVWTYRNNLRNGGI